MGVIGGRFVGTAGGILVSIPSLLLGEWLTLPMNVLAGFLAGLLRHVAPEREAVWSFSPLFDLSIYHWIRRSIRKSLIDWQTSFFLLILALEFVRIQLHRAVSAPHLRPRQRQLAGGARDLRRHRHGRRHRPQGPEQRAHRDEARAAGAIAVADAHGSPAKPDQSSLPVQHPEFGVIAGAPRSRFRARDDRQAQQHPATTAAQRRFVRPAARGGRIRRRLPRHRSRALRSRKAQGGQGTRPRFSRPSGAQHDPAATGRERDQARAC